MPKNADPYEDQFEKKSEAKSERVAKNELQRLRNMAKAKKVAVPAAKGLAPKERQSKEEVRAFYFNAYFLPVLKSDVNSCET